MNNFEREQAPSAPQCASAIPSGSIATDRYHSLDGLRASMMLLGLVLHSAISYGTIYHHNAWPYQDNNTSRIFDVTVLFIHTFRMPIFFVMAGFFAALLIEKRGLRSFLRNRTTRIAIPFLVSWFLLVPVTILGFIFATRAKVEPTSTALSGAIEDARNFGYVADTTIHLWFLYYLLFFYAALTLLLPIVRGVSKPIREKSRQLFEGVLRSRLRVLVLSTPLAGALLTMDSAVLETSTSFAPDVRTLAVYFGFFLFGVALYGSRTLLSTFEQSAWRSLTLACLTFLLYGAALEKSFTGPAEARQTAHFVAAVSGAIVTWLLTFGITGVFIRYRSKPSRATRYVVDASYWLYLTHLPLAIWLPGLLAGIELPAVLKFLAVAGTLTVVLLLLYDFCVRSTWIGAQLSGQRYPRGLPLLEADRG